MKLIQEIMKLITYYLKHTQNLRNKHQQIRIYSESEFYINNRAPSNDHLYLCWDIDSLSKDEFLFLIIARNKLIIDTSDFSMRSGFTSTYILSYCEKNSYFKKSLFECRSKFENFAFKFKNQEVTLFATGPSLQKAYSDDFKSKGISIICNTIVKDIVLLEKIKPKILIAMDSDFHWGPSKYCELFRDDVKRCIKKFGTYLFIPFAIYPLVCKLLPEYIDFIIGIPVEGISPNFNLGKFYCTNAIDNVLLNMFLPLSCTIAKEINLIGFDGRSKTDNKFWAHNNKTQYTDHLQTIEFSHPAFFICRNYLNYSINHKNIEVFFTQ